MKGNQTMPNVKQLYQGNPEFRDTRLKSLFSDFTRLKESNPEGYNANLNVWRHFLSTFFEIQESLSFDFDHLMKQLVYKTNSKTYEPDGIFTVINEMLDDKSIILLSELKDNKLEGGKSRILETAKWFIFGQVKIDIREKSLRNKPLVFVPKIEKYSKEVELSLLPLLEEGPVNLDHLQNILSRNKLRLTKEDLIFVLLFLKREIQTFNIDNEIIYSTSPYSTEDGKNVDASELKHLTDLNYTIYKLHLYNDEKSQEIEELDRKIKESLRAKNQFTARSQLKLKKMLELQVQKTLSSLENLHTLKIKVEDAQNNVLISKVWKDNSRVLKILNEEAKDKDLDAVFDTLYDEIQNTNSLSEKLGEGMVDQGEDEEIEKDLMKLEASVKEAEMSGGSDVEEVRKKLDSLKLPQTEPQKAGMFIEEPANESKEESPENEKRTALYS